MTTLRGFAGGSFISQTLAGGGGSDTTPDAFAFTGQFNVPTASLRTSNTITVTGIDAPSPISISGDASSKYSVNGGSYTAVPGAVILGDQVTVQHNSSGSASSQVDTILSIGGVLGTFTSITAAAVAPVVPVVSITPAVVQTSKADLLLIFNMTLGRLGVGQAVGSPSENSIPAKLCNRFYNQCRQEVLRAHPWGFALRAEPLALVAEQTFPGWSYVYQYPIGCITMRAVADSAGIRRVFSSTLTCDPCWPTLLRQVRMPWQKAIKTDGASQCLLSDVSTAWGFYTVDVANTGAWDVDFASVVADRLAMEVGGPLQARADLIVAAGQRYAIWFSQAAANSMNEQKDDPVPESPSILARY